MQLSRAASSAAADAILALIASVEIRDTAGKRLAVLPYPALKAKAEASGEASRWRINDASGAAIASGKVGEGLTLDRTDIQYGGTVSIDSIQIEVTS
jgi:hypothetical protein